MTYVLFYNVDHFVDPTFACYKFFHDGDNAEKYKEDIINEIKSKVKQWNWGSEGYKSYCNILTDEDECFFLEIGMIETID